MPKRIAVIATKAKFKEIRKFFRKASAFELDASTDDYLSVGDWFLYRIDNKRNNFIDAYEWDGYIDGVGWEMVGDPDSHQVRVKLIQCILLLEAKGAPIFHSAKLSSEMEDLEVPF